MSARILILTTGGSWGGAESQAVHQAQYLSKRGYRVTVGTLADGDGFLPRELSSCRDIASFSLHATKLTPWRVMDLAVRLSKKRFSLIIAHLFHSCLAARIIGRLLSRTPVISVFHSGNQGPWRTFLDRATMPLTQFFVTVSEDSADFARRVIKVPGNKLRVIPNGIDPFLLRSPKCSRERTRHAFGLDRHDYVIGCVARLHPVNDHLTLIRAFNELKGKTCGNRAKLLLVGTGKAERRARKLIGRLGLQEHVVFSGFRRDLPDLYSAMDVACLTSRCEGLGVAVLEAMAVGLPIVATSAQGFASFLWHKENALIAPTGGFKGIADALIAISQRPEMAKHLGETARREACQKFSLEVCMAQYLELNSKSPGRRAKVIEDVLSSPPLAL